MLSAMPPLGAMRYETEEREPQMNADAQIE
jgi:hypothetical protein